MKFNRNGSGRVESAEARAERIAAKQKMPCSACKAHGKTAYGQWHSDPAGFLVDLRGGQW